MKKLHIIEPTLSGTAGHCYTVVHALAKAGVECGDIGIELWADRALDVSLLKDMRVKTHAYFSRKVRRIQIYFLLKKLLGRGETVLLPTASRAELTAFALLSDKIKKKGKIFFYIHQMRMEGSKKKRLQMIAAKAQEAHILCTTLELEKNMKLAGFPNVKVQLCPFEVPEVKPEMSAFRHVIFPGVARMDKNFPFVVKLVKKIKEEQDDIPLFIQAGPNHHGEFSDEVLSCIQSLKALQYSRLEMPCASLEGAEYLQQFSGGICLQPYWVGDYSDKISGITLDALARGCPVIIAHGIHSAELVEKYQAGISIQGYDEQVWLDAVKEVMARYDFYQANCHRAFDFLVRHHHPKRMLEAMW